MKATFRAIVEHGLLRPLVPVKGLVEHAQVDVTVSTTPASDCSTSRTAVHQSLVPREIRDDPTEPTIDEWEQT